MINFAASSFTIAGQELCTVFQLLRREADIFHIFAQNFAGSLFVLKFTPPHKCYTTTVLYVCFGSRVKQLSVLFAVHIF